MPAIIEAFRCQRLFVMAFALVTLTLGCGGERHKHRVEQTLARSDKAMLLREAERVWKQRRSDLSGELPAGEWPHVFRDFEPEKVIIDRAGVFVCTHSVFVRDAGLFVALDPTFKPPKNEPSYEHLGGVFYWYDIND